MRAPGVELGVVVATGTLLSTQVNAQTTAPANDAAAGGGSGAANSTVVFWVAVALASVAAVLFGVCLLRRYRQKRDEDQLSISDIQNLPDAPAKSGDDIASESPTGFAPNRYWDVAALPGGPEDLSRRDDSGYITIEMPPQGSQLSRILWILFTSCGSCHTFLFTPDRHCNVNPPQIILGPIERHSLCKTLYSLAQMTFGSKLHHCQHMVR